MPQVRETIVDPAGEELDGVRIVVRLVAFNDRSKDAGFTGSETILFSTETETDSSGEWSLDLEANDNIEPSPSSYEVVATDPQNRISDSVRTIEVPDSEGPHEVGDIRVFLSGDPIVTVQGDTGPQGDSIEYDWDGTQLGVRVEGEENYTYSDLEGPTGPQGDSIEYDWDGTQLGVRVEGESSYDYTDLEGPKGDQGEQGDTGPQGDGLEYDWDGTELGVRVEGDSTYTYTDLEGPEGPQGQTGPQGDSLEYDWDGTELGVRVEGESSYTYTDLQGEVGPIGITWQGDWDSGTAYDELDAVHHGGSAWIATEDTSAGEEPGTSAKWDLIAESAEFENADINDLNDVDTSGASDGDALTYDSGSGEWVPGAGGVTDHGELSGLGDDDHEQYALADGTRGDFAATGHDHDSDYEAAGTVSDHESASDPHSQYATDSKVDSLGPSDVGADPAGTASSEVDSHESASDPHSQYLDEVSATATYASHVGTATAPITDPSTARPHGEDGMVTWFTDFSAEAEDEPDNMEPQDLQVRVDEAESNGGS